MKSQNRLTPIISQVTAGISRLTKLIHRILTAACKRVGIVGASTHSFRRIALTTLHNEGVPLRIIQTISGHKSLATLQKYLEVTEKDKEEAISLLSWNQSK